MGRRTSSASEKKLFTQLMKEPTKLTDPEDVAILKKIRKTLAVLVRKGLVRDSGKRKDGQIVWVATSKEAR